MIQRTGSRRSESSRAPRGADRLQNSLNAHLPRLPRSCYLADAAVHWTMCVDRRQSGWLNPVAHLGFREAFLHACVKFEMLCPVYCLMPDHIHFVWVGSAAISDQRAAIVYFRTNTGSLLKPFKWQREPFDHVMRDAERRRGAFAKICDYVLENPARASISERGSHYPFSGSCIPGYPNLSPHRADFWEVFWKIFETKRGIGVEVRVPRDAAT